MNLLHWITSDWTHAYAALDAVLGCSVFLWGIWTASYERQTGHKMPASKLTLLMGFFMDLSKNIPGLANRALEQAGKQPLFLPKPPSNV